MQTIMIVEDEVILLEAISKKFALSKINTVSCTTGKQALDYLKSLPSLPNAIWLDYYLKDMNGLELMEELKKNPQWSQIPVIVVSNSASEEKVKQMLALGVTKYILKAEVRLEDLVETFKKLLPSIT